MDYNDFYKNTLDECNTYHELVTECKDEINHPKLSDLKNYIKIQLDNSLNKEI